MEMPPDTRRTGDAEHVRELRRRQRWIRVIGTLLAIAIVGLIPVLFPQLTFADAFLKILLGSALAAAVIAGAWITLIHGDLRQRSDYAVAITLALVMFALAGVANWLYQDDWVWAKTCSFAADAYPDECSDAAASFRQTHNAANLDHIYGVLAVGQLIPLLSIFKDAVYCWRRPTHWMAISDDMPDRGRIRQANLRLTRVHSSSPED